MKNLFETVRVEEIKQRMALLTPESERQWGKMNVAQAVAHCARAFEVPLGELQPPRMFIGYILGGLIKPKVVGNDDPMRPNSPTVPGFIVDDARHLDTEREKVSSMIDRFVAAGPQGCTQHPHSFFGRLTPEQWATLMYKHMDHHLRQFGV